MRSSRGDFLRTAGLALVSPGVAWGARRPGGPPELFDLRVTSGSRPVAGDHRLLATVSPRRRTPAVVSLRVLEPVRVTMEAVRTDTIRIGAAGRRRHLADRARSRTRSAPTPWTPSADAQPRTYILRLTVEDGADRRRVYGGRRPGSGGPPAPVVRVQGVDIATARRSYAPGEPTELLISTDANALRVQVFHYGGSSRPGEPDLRTNGRGQTATRPLKRFRPTADEYFDS